MANHTKAQKYNNRLNEIFDNYKKNLIKYPLKTCKLCGKDFVLDTENDSKRVTCNECEQ